MTKDLQQYQYALILKEVGYEKHYRKLFENPVIYFLESQIANKKGVCRCVQLFCRRLDVPAPLKNCTIKIQVDS